LSTEYEALLKMMLMTLSFSRAMVQSAWMVYIDVPSPISASTGRSGQAMAAPTALGRPWPMAPPVSVMRSWRGAPAVNRAQHQPRGDGLVDEDGVVGSRWPTALQTFSAR
jgi:hypothetical protein